MQLQGLPGSSSAAVVVRDRRTYFACKRIMDVALCSLILIAAAPLMMLIAVLIRLDSPGPAMFKQTRIGRDGRPFTMYKFRTMRHYADPEMHHQYVRSFIRNQLPVAGSSEDATALYYKLTTDPRITRVGRGLRRASLDELPQIFNVLKGEMSLVGPRPPLQYEVCEYAEWHKGRLATVPGITGWWQVRGRSRVPFDEMVRMDMEYIARQSLWLDIQILILTVGAVLSSEGAE